MGSKDIMVHGLQKRFSKPPVLRGKTVSLLFFKKER
jgi:hypothetical protein